jgi:putative copper resistance protein D
VDSLVLIRTLHLAAVLIPPAILMFQRTIARPVWQDSREIGREMLAAIEKSLLSVAMAGIVAAFPISLLWLVVVASRISDGPLSFQVVETVLTATHFGRTWIAHIGLILLSCGSCGLLLRHPTRRYLLPVSWMFSEVTLISTTFFGHAAATTRPTISMTVDAMHLLAASFWPAGLLPMAFCLAKLRRSPELNIAASTITERFSRMSLLAVPVLALTGSLNSWLIAGSLLCFHNLYDRILFAKIVVFGIMVGIGAVNLWKIKPRLVQRVESRKVVTVLLLSVSLEAALASIVLILTAILGQTSPR